jgi:hypothetical protein
MEDKLQSLEKALNQNKNLCKWTKIITEHGFSAHVTKKDKCHLRITYKGYCIGKIDTKSSKNNTIGDKFISTLINQMRKGIQKYYEIKSKRLETKECSCNQNKFKDE